MTNGREELDDDDVVVIKLGKTTIATHLAGLLPSHVLQTLQLDCTVEWDPTIPKHEQCGILFQQTTLLDELTVAGNLAVAIQACPKQQQQQQQQQKQQNSTTSTTTNISNSTSTSVSKSSSAQDLEAKIKQWMEAVGLDYARDGHKRPSQLSGGMARRASLALSLAQHKHVIVLDEPFTGLDYEAAVSIAKELVQIRTNPYHQPALVLISHEPDLAAMVMDPVRTTHNKIVVFQEPKQPPSKPDEAPERNGTSPKHKTPRLLFGTKFLDRFQERLMDYIVWSFPLIVLTFIACGLALSMLTADLLQRIDVTQPVLEIVEREVQPLIKLLTGEEPTSLTMMGVKFKVRSLLQSTVPKGKATIYAIGMTKGTLRSIGSSRYFD